MYLLLLLELKQQQTHTKRQLKGQEDSMYSIRLLDSLN